MNLLGMAATGTFLYKVKLFQQIDGVAMGSPTTPTFANFFVIKMEKKIMSIASENHSLLYVDDIFGVFETNEPVLKFLDISKSFFIVC